MPIYEFRCADCGHITSVFVRSIAATPSPACEACQGTKMTRAVSRPALIRSSKGSDAGTLAPADPRRAIQQMGEMYNQHGDGPGKAFNEIVGRASAGDSPQDLKEAIKEARQKESTSPPPSPKD